MFSMSRLRQHDCCVTFALRPKDKLHINELTFPCCLLTLVTLNLETHRLDIKTVLASSGFFSRAETSKRTTRLCGFQAAIFPGQGGEFATSLQSSRRCSEHEVTKQLLCLIMTSRRAHSPQTITRLTDLTHI